ncbi:hypothetical protein FJR11_09590 [Anabaena sp. UHCC 0187]|jgi:hypothetical protein|uniref:hypothetical protein n=1 Tax=Anabaena sp. UHCC 0187 TaxID=2590018 RepID=UPI0014476CAD|nr:hypothetical protein [Anabaena sp. UHCC 0187]MDP5016991.1 hypothetical protein [Dolichospermum sp.]MTJ12838.1 hypothetical protein [Anabaena sp. UHCC 0187]
MTLEEIAGTLTELFSAEVVKSIAPGSWQVETPDFRLLVLLSEDNTWLRVLLPIMPLQEAAAFLTQFLEANFDDTQETRYAVYDGVVWGVFQHNSGTLTNADFANAIARLISLYEAGVNDVFNNLVETRIREIVKAAKQQGQSLAATMQNLDRFYAEGLLGDIDQNPQGREQVLAAWRQRLERLWVEI